MSGSVQSFVEESCWDRSDRRRSTRHPVVFRLALDGEPDRELRADFGLFYDPEDSELLAHLYHQHPDVEWSGFVFWKQSEQGRILIIDPLTDQSTGSIIVRRRARSPSGEIDWTNVVVPIAWRPR